MKRQIASLTSLRGLAAWWVVLYHFQDALHLRPGGVMAALVERGFLAVDLFFILSGYVILLNYRELFEPFTLKACSTFMLRRLARIYPLHAVVMLLFLLNPLAIVLFSHAATPGPRYDPAYYGASLLLVQNWGFFPVLAWNIPAWSISTEMAAYLLFPLLLTLLRRFTGGLAAHIAAVAAVCGLLALACRAAGLASIGSDIETFGVLRCVIEFFIGMLLANLQHRLADRPAPRLHTGAALAFGALLLVAVFGAVPDYVVFPALFACLILYLVMSPDTANGWLQSRWLLHLGEISYSSYLIHFFVKDWVKFLSAAQGLPQLLIYVAAVYALSWVLYRTVEVPGRAFIQKLATPGPAGTRPVNPLRPSR